ncbi:conserved hypothetical protein [Neospora caninum Liverpool]|uniref:Transmembrane protein n=1 Tax=Neospora caninum (strain Liverpool) TaxID=572307 RepID=F0VPD5_NEOCL|nr:conserved hypothetical protein [Neospora caninum Liverpool]CBZ55581.1 conserved hypothetical protein [Neospora caninum Liverpool]|eukprot:XP_003885609.1 conserved hypothetical protein [Neospora caninum Liverpool]
MATAFCSSGPSGPFYLHSKSECGSSTEERDESMTRHGASFSSGLPEAYRLGARCAPTGRSFDSTLRRGPPGQPPGPLRPSTPTRRAHLRQTSRLGSTQGGNPSMFYASPGPWEFSSSFNNAISMATPFHRQFSSSSALGYSAGEASTAFGTVPPVLGLPRLAYESEVALIHFAVYLICAVGCVCVYYNLVVLEAYVLALFWAVVFSIPLRTAMNVLKRLILLSAERSIEAVAAAKLAAATAGGSEQRPGASSSSLPSVNAKSIFRRSPPRLASSASSALTGEFHTGTPPPEGTGGFVAPEVYRHRSTSESIVTRLVSRVMPSVAPTAAAAESLLAQENIVIAEKLESVGNTLQEVLEESRDDSGTADTSGLDAAKLPGLPTSSEHLQSQPGAASDAEIRTPQGRGETEHSCEAREAPGRRRGASPASVRGRPGEASSPSFLPSSERGGVKAAASPESGAASGVDWKPGPFDHAQRGSEEKGSPGLKKNLREDRPRLSSALAAANRPREGVAPHRNLDLDRRLRGGAAGAGGVRTPSGRYASRKHAGRARLSPVRKVGCRDPGSSRDGRPGAAHDSALGSTGLAAAQTGADPTCTSFVRQPSWSLLGDVVLSSSLVRLPARFLLFMLEPLLSLVSPSPPGEASARHASRPWFALLYRSCLLLVVYRVVSSCTRYSVSTVLLSAAGVGLLSLLVRFVLIIAGKEEAANKSLKWLSPPSLLTPLCRLLGLLHGSMQSSLNPILAIIVMLTSVFIVSLIVAFFCFQFYNEITLLWDAFQRTIDTYILRSSTMQQALQTIHSFAGASEAEQGSSRTNTTAPASSSLSASQILFNLIAKAANAATANSDQSATRSADGPDGPLAGSEAAAAPRAPAKAPGAMESIGATIAAAIAAGTRRGADGRAADGSAASHLKQLLGASIGRYSDLWLSIRHFAAANAGAPVAKVSVTAPGGSPGPALGFSRGTSAPGGLAWKDGGDSIPVVIVRQPGPQARLPGAEAVFSPGEDTTDSPPPVLTEGGFRRCDDTRVARRGVAATTQAPSETPFSGPGSRDRPGSVVWPFSWFFRWTEAGERRERGAVIRAGLLHFVDEGKREARDTLNVSLEAPDPSGDAGAFSQTRGKPDRCPADGSLAFRFPETAFGAPPDSCVREKAKEADLFDSAPGGDLAGACSGTGSQAGVDAGQDWPRAPGTFDSPAGDDFALSRGRGPALAEKTAELSGGRGGGQTEVGEWLSDGTPVYARAAQDDVARWHGAGAREDPSREGLHGDVWKRWENTAELIGQLRRGNLSGAAGKAKEAVVFFSALYYLLCSSRSCLEYLEELLCIVDPSCIVSHSINRGLRAILYSSFKRFWFYSLFTWFVYESAGMPVVYVPTAVSGLLALLPLLPPESVSVIPCLVLWWGRGEEAVLDAQTLAAAASPGRREETSAGFSGTAAGAWWAVLSVAAGSQRKLGAVTLLAANAVVWWNVTTAIYREIPDSNPWLVGLSVALGLSTFGMKGIIIGPVLATIPLIVLTAAAKFSERRTREHQLAAMVAQQTAASPLASPRGGRSRFAPEMGASPARRRAAKRRRPRPQPGAFASASEPSAADRLWPGSRPDPLSPTGDADGLNAPESPLHADDLNSWSESGRTSSVSSWENGGDAVAGIKEVISGPPASPAAAAAAVELADAAHAAAVAKVATLVGDAGGVVTSPPVAEVARKLTGRATSTGVLQPHTCEAPQLAGAGLVDPRTPGARAGADAGAPPGRLSAPWKAESLGAPPLATEGFVVPLSYAAAASVSPVGMALHTAPSGETNSSLPLSDASDRTEPWWSLPGGAPGFFAPEGLGGRASAGVPSRSSARASRLGAVDRRHRDPRVFWPLRKPSKRSRAVSSAMRMWPSHSFRGRMPPVHPTRRHGPSGRDSGRFRAGEMIPWEGAPRAGALSTDLSLPALFAECGLGRAVEGVHASRVLPGRASSGPVPPLFQRMASAWTGDGPARCAGELAARDSGRRSSLACSNRSAPQLKGLLGGADDVDSAAEMTRRSASKPEQGPERGSGDAEKARSSSMLAAAVLKTAQKLEWLLDRSSGAPAEPGSAEEACGQRPAGRSADEAGKWPLAPHGACPQPPGKAQAFREGVRHPPLVPAKEKANAVGDAEGGTDIRGGKAVRGGGKATLERTGKGAGSRASLASPVVQSTCNAANAGAPGRPESVTNSAAAEEVQRPATQERQRDKKAGEAVTSK